MAFVPSRLAAALASLAVAALVAWLFLRRSLVPLDEQAVPQALKVISAVATLAALFQLVRLCVFIINPAQVGFAVSTSRGLGLIPDHSCLSAYYVAARAASTVPNIYADELYSLPSPPTSMRKPRRLESFDIDVYEYPPPFLLVPRALAIVAPQFLPFRMLWFALNGALLLLGLLVVARVMGPEAGTRALLFAPLVLACDLTIATLQAGNLHAVVFSLAMIAMLLLARRRFIAGGALLAYATLSKLFPGLLLVYLLFRRQWRALAWTCAMCVVLILISLLDTGSTPYKAFLQHLPRLVGGESFPAFRNPRAIAKNYSVPGMMMKLQLFGIGGPAFRAMKIVGWLYTLVVLGATVILARRTSKPAEEPLVWLTILTLASLRSPFLPGYAVIPALWLLTLLAATVPARARTLCLVLLAWGILNITGPLKAPDPRLTSALLLLPQAVMVILIVLAVRKPPDSSDGTTAPPDLAIAPAN